MNKPKIKAADASYKDMNKTKKMYILKRLWGYLSQFKIHIVFAVLLTVISNILALLGPKYAGKAIGVISDTKNGLDFDSVFYYCILLMGFYVISSLCSYVLSILMIRLSRRVSARMRKDVFDHLLTLPVGFFDINQPGDLINRISYDIDTINSSLASDLIQICTSIITVVGSLVMMLTIKPILVLVFMVTIPISFYFTSYMARKVRPLFRTRSVKLGELNGYIEETLSAQRTIKSYCIEETITDKFHTKNCEAVEAYYQADYYGSSVGPSVNLINNLSLALISLFGTLLYCYNKISVGDLSSFVLYSRKFSGPINEAANIVSELQSAMSASERVFKLLDEPSEKPDSVDSAVMIETKGDISAENVKFGYLPEKTIIHDLSFKAESGNVIAIVGPTGAGKTTIINLLMRFYDPDSGCIRLDGTNINDITRKSLRGAYTMVLQDTWLFQGTIYENIAYGCEKITQEKVMEAAKGARIHSYIEKLPEGYNTVLSDDGINISKGQKQLLTIARAMTANAKLLILDEATSNVDSLTEIHIQDAMKNLTKGKTCFIIAHRLSTIQNADLILFVKDGDIIEQGNHEQLLEAKGFYFSLYNSQFS